MSAPQAPPNWAEVLEQVQQAIAQAEQETARSAEQFDQILGAEPTAKEVPSDSSALEPLLQQLRQHVEQAGQSVSEAESALEKVETDLRAWAAQSEALARKLAATTVTSVR